MTPNNQQATILIIEDNLINIENVMNVLENQSFNVIIARDGEMGVRRAKLTCPDLILLDVGLPGIDGYEVCRLLKEDDQTKHIPVLFMTIMDNAGGSVKGFQAGAVDYVIKPVQPAELIARINTHLQIESQKKQLQDAYDKLEKRVIERTTELAESNINLKAEIVERQRIEESLRESEEKFRQFFENQATYCYMISPAGVIVDINKAALNVLGYTKKEVLGQPLDMIYAPESWTQMEQSMAEWNKTASVSKDTEMTIITKEGNKRIILLNAKAIKDIKGNALYTISVQNDITERRQLEIMLRQAQKMEAVGRLTGGIAHDFSNLLTIIILFSDLILRTSEPSNKVHQHAEKIKSAGNQAASFIQQLLAFSRQQVLQPKLLNLNVVAAESEELLRRLIGGDIVMSLDLEPELGIIKADKGQMQQVLLNLIVNARDAMPDGGNLIIETSNIFLDEASIDKDLEIEPGGYVLLSVSDTGIGMDAEVQARIFDPFFTTKELGKGTGLGLATVHGIVSQSGGYIRIYTEPEQGTTFKIYFPQTGQIEQPIRQEIPSVTHSLPKATILVVDDELFLRDSLREILEEAGHTVFTAKDGSEARQICEEYSEGIELLIMDVMIPGREKGPEIADSLKKQYPTALKLLFISGFTNNVIAHHGVLNPNINFLSKPFSASAFHKKVYEVLEEA